MRHAKRLQPPVRLDRARTFGATTERREDARQRGAGSASPVPLRRRSALSSTPPNGEIEEQLERATKRANKLIEKQVDADADELKREIKAADEEGAAT
jgi:hypothetical protein